MQEYIETRKKELDAIIIAHYYQLPEVQDIADFVGDSLQMAQVAAATDAKVIVTCGVSFMAETAGILSPDKVVLLPDPEAGCPMADMVTADALRRKKAEHPGALVVSYVNTSAEVKAESYICCTSSNALSVIRTIPREREIIFVPDRNLGYYIQKQSGRPMILWEGCCPVHDLAGIQELEKQIALHPDALVVVHPECPPAVTDRADAVRSTSGILQYVKESTAKKFIIGTEEGFLYTLRKHCPDKELYLARQDFVCSDMKKITLEKIARSLETLEPRVTIAEDIRIKAREALDRMMAVPRD